MSLYNVGIAFDQFINACIGGSPDETLSARAWRLKDVSLVWKCTRWCIDTLFFWQKGHCAASYNSEMERKQLPEEYRKF